MLLQQNGVSSALTRRAEVAVLCGAFGGELPRREKHRRAHGGRGRRLEGSWIQYHVWDLKSMHAARPDHRSFFSDPVLAQAEEND